jgi:hypothetical protein
LSSGKVIIIMGLDQPESRVSLPEARIQDQRFCGCRFGLGRAFSRRLNSQDVAEVIGIGEPGIGQREVRISLGCLLEKLDAFPNARPRSLVQMIAGVEIELISFGVVRYAPGQS